MTDKLSQQPPGTRSAKRRALWESTLREPELSALAKARAVEEVLLLWQGQGFELYVKLFRDDTLRVLSTTRSREKPRVFKRLIGAMKSIKSSCEINFPIRLDLRKMESVEDLR